MSKAAIDKMLSKTKSTCNQGTWGEFTVPGTVINSNKNACGIEELFGSPGCLNEGKPEQFSVLGWLPKNKALFGIDYNIVVLKSLCTSSRRGCTLSPVRYVLSSCENMGVVNATQNMSDKGFKLKTDPVNQLINLTDKYQVSSVNSIGNNYRIDLIKNVLSPKKL